MCYIPNLGKIVPVVLMKKGYRRTTDVDARV